MNDAAEPPPPPPVRLPFKWLHAVLALCYAACAFWLSIFFMREWHWRTWQLPPRLDPLVYYGPDSPPQPRLPTLYRHPGTGWVSGPLPSEAAVDVWVERMAFAQHSSTVEWLLSGALVGVDEVTTFSVEQVRCVLRGLADDFSVANLLLAGPSLAAAFTPAQKADAATSVERFDALQRQRHRLAAVARMKLEQCVEHLPAGPVARTVAAEVAALPKARFWELTGLEDAHRVLSVVALQDEYLSWSFGQGLRRHLDHTRSWTGVALAHAWVPAALFPFVRRMWVLRCWRFGHWASIAIPLFPLSRAVIALVRARANVVRNTTLMLLMCLLVPTAVFYAIWLARRLREMRALARDVAAEDLLARIKAKKKEQADLEANPPLVLLVNERSSLLRKIYNAYT